MSTTKVSAASGIPVISGNPWPGTFSTIRNLPSSSGSAFIYYYGNPLTSGLMSSGLVEITPGGISGMASHSSGPAGIMAICDPVISGRVELNLKVDFF